MRGSQSCIAAGVFIALAILITGCASSGRSAPDSSPVDRADRRVRPGRIEKGQASWYGPNFHGRRTANGELYDMYGVSAAHKTLPFDTEVRVENLANGKKLVVRINDRGPFIRGRIIDLSLGAARKLDMVEAGVVPVRLTVLRAGSGEYRLEESDSYLIQVGAFREKHNAEQLRREIRPRFKAQIYYDGLWHRVQVRNLRSRDDARSMLKDLQRRGYDAFLSACKKADCG